MLRHVLSYPHNIITGKTNICRTKNQHRQTFGWLTAAGYFGSFRFRQDYRKTNENNEAKRGGASRR
ncbi:hypothetical protein ACOJCT_004567, partial [Cronobacter dublinensis]